MKYIYADYNATTPCSPEHNKKVLNLLRAKSANPSSIHHLGRETKLILEEAREKVASVLGAPKNNIFFTSGATESNNCAIQGHVFHRFFQQKKAKIFISNAEHSSIFQTARYLEGKGLCELFFIPVNKYGFVDKESLLEHFRSDATLVSLIHVNNETGAISNILELVSLIKEKSPMTQVHVDAVQSYGKLDMRMFHSSPVDSISASAHKIGGFKGVGCHYLKNPLNFSPLIIGGGQERNYRAGTENIPGIISFGLRAEEVVNDHSLINKVKVLRDALIKGLREISEVHLHSNPEYCLPTTVNFHLEGVSGEELLFTFDSAGIYVSSGSACASGGGKPSRVLEGMGYTQEIASSSIRISFGDGNTLEDVDLILKTLLDLLRSKKRRISK